jgi:hypothetical protein
VWNTNRKTSMNRKIALSVQTGEWPRTDYPAEVELRVRQLNLEEAVIRLVEEDQEGNVIDDSVPCQLDQGADGVVTVTFLLTGETPAHTQRFYALIRSDTIPHAVPQVECTDGVMHQEQESYRIKTPAATYIYHKFGAGFASLYDPDGCDWISYRPFGGSDGKYRGIPNIAHPENYFHPGGNGCTSKIVSSGPLKVKIVSESIDDKWACTWEIFPAHARLTILKVDHPYWLLYEGTPGGHLDESGDYCVRSDGTRLPLTERWEMPLPSPKWIYFGTSNTRRVLYLVQHEADSHVDSFWPMEQNMTVFGFGRRGLEKHMTATPAHFTIGFAEDGAFDVAQQVINAAFNPVEVTLRPE